MTSTTGIGSGSLQLVSKDSLDSQLTAKNLMDKEVYDRNGKKIGKVVDVVLADQTGTLSSAFSSESSRGSGAGSNYASSSTPSSSASGTTSGRSGGSSSSSSELGSSAGAAGSSYAAASSVTAVIVSRGGMFGMGKELLRVPMSQLNYDSSAKHFRLNITDTEIEGLNSNSSSGSSSSGSSTTR